MAFLAGCCTIHEIVFSLSFTALLQVFAYCLVRSKSLLFFFPPLQLRIMTSEMYAFGMLSAALCAPPNVLSFGFPCSLALIEAEAENTERWRRGNKKFRRAMRLKQHMMRCTVGTSRPLGSKCHLIAKYWFPNSDLQHPSHQSEDSPSVLLRIPLHRSWLTVSD